MPKLEWFAALAALAEHGTFTAAAGALHVSQPALHAQVRKLAEALGVPLYVRQGRRVALTEAGKRAAAFARELDRRTHDLMHELDASVAREPVVLAAGEGAMLYLVDEAIRRFVRHGPAPLSLLTRDREGTLQALRSARAHVGVIAGDPPGDLVAEPLDDVAPLLAMPSRHPLAARRRVSITALAGEPLVVAPPGGPLRERVAAELATAGLELRVGVEARGWELTLHFVGLGLGLAIVNACCRLPKGIVARPISGLPSVRYWVLARSELGSHAPTQALAEQIRETARAWRDRPQRAIRRTQTS